MKKTFNASAVQILPLAPRERFEDLRFISAYEFTQKGMPRAVKPDPDAGMEPGYPDLKRWANEVFNPAAHTLLFAGPPERFDCLAGTVTGRLHYVGLARPVAA